jgi:hypothetical protein
VTFEPWLTLGHGARRCACAAPASLLTRQRRAAGAGAMAKFRDIRTLQKFAAVHASINNHFHQDRHLNRRNVFKQKRSVALAEWCQLAA